MANEKSKGCCLGILGVFAAVMIIGYCAGRQQQKENAERERVAAAEAQALKRANAAAQALVDGGAKLLLQKTNLSKLSLEQKEDLNRVRAAWNATSARPASLEHWSNTAALLWVLKARAEARQVVKTMMMRFPGAAGNPGVRLNAHLITGEQQYNRTARASRLVWAQQKYNLNFRSQKVPLPLISGVADDRKLPPRLRAKALCLLGVQYARTAVAMKNAAALRKSLDAFARAQRLDPRGAIGKLAAENERILRSRNPNPRQMGAR
jgi:hypothetical protein